MSTQLVIVTGLSGSGKSVALSALEDMGFYCVDNLPLELLEAFIALQKKNSDQKLAVAIDARTRSSLTDLPDTLVRLKADGIESTCIFLDASDDVITIRYSETRRLHPLSKRAEYAPSGLPLMDCIQHERTLMAPLKKKSVVVDTSLLKPANLLTQIKSLVASNTYPLQLLFESFAFKRGIPQDADFIFDVRGLPTPYYQPDLRNLTGKDKAVIDFLSQRTDVMEMIDDIQSFLVKWLPTIQNDGRSYLTVGIGCTGGQHRSVYIADQLAARLQATLGSTVRHREI